MTNLVFATSNAYKAREIQVQLGASFGIKTLSDLGFTGDIPETGSTLEENALIKAQTVFDRYGMPTFADDTGLEVAALHGEPGVYSARYAGEQATYHQNCELLLQNLLDASNRSAVFKTVFCFIDANGEPHYFKGEVPGSITRVFRGTGGFGYDPLFLPDGATKTFAEMSLEEKNSISHRGLAVRELVAFLQKTGK